MSNASDPTTSCAFPVRDRTAAPVRRALFLAIAFSALIASCSDATRPEQAGPPASVLVVSGDNQEGVVGQELGQPLVVRVVDAHDRAVRGQLVNFRVIAGGGSVFAGSGLTNAQGIVQDRWTLGTSVSGEQRVEARAVDPNTGAAIVFAAFRARAKPGPAATLAKAEGDGGSGPAGQALADSIAVRVTDQYGNPIAGTLVSWSAAADGSGSVSPSTSTTDVQGVAKSQWTLGTRVRGTQTVTAASGTIAPVQFSATATLPGSASLVKIAGDAQAGVYRRALPESLVVRVQLQSGQPVIGATVAWSVTSGGGTVSPATALTNSNGEARTQWTPGALGGGNSVMVSVLGLASVTFSATTALASGSTISVVSGNGQTTLAAGGLFSPLVVKVADPQGQPISGIPVTWSVSSGGGSVDPPVRSTDAVGQAQTTWRLGCPAGPQSVAASAPGAGSVTFTATAEPRAARDIWLSGVPASAPAGSQHRLTVRVTDECGNAIPNYSYGFTIMPNPQTGQYNTGLGIDPMSGRTGVDGTGTHTVTVGGALVDQCAYILGPLATKFTFCVRGTP